VAAALQISLGGVLPDDRPAAAVLSDGANVSITRQVQRSALMKAAGGLARRVAAASVHPDAVTHAGAGPHR
jgi:hypothetical protein